MILFLEGLSKSGKSTLLRECLKPYASQLGGFSSQRLWKDDYASYRILPASCFELDTEYDPDMEHVFRYFYKDKTEKNPDVFKYYGVELLEQAHNYPLILLDEIGGAELLVPEFKEKLYEILRGPVPCIGVIKLSEKAKFMKKEAGYGSDVVTFNNELRDYITSLPGSRIINFTRETRDEAKKEIMDFLERIF